MQSMRFFSSTFIVLSSLSLAACGPGEGNGEPDAGTNPADCGDSHATITAQQLYTEVVQPRCQSCHYQGALDTSLVLDSAAALKSTVGADSTYGGGLKVSEANRSENSTMYLKVLGGTPAGVRGPNGQAVGQRMPVTGALTLAERQQIQDWICTGAQ